MAARGGQGSVRGVQARGVDHLSQGLAGSAFALALIVPVDLWVYLDARRRERVHDEVQLEFGPLTFDRPSQWLAGCIVLFVIFVPAYLVARKHSG